MKINAEEFKPKIKGISDFYSWNLYRWLKNNPHLQTIWMAPADVFCSHETAVIGGERDGSWISGARMMSVLCSRGRLGRLAYHADFKTREWKDVTSEFWDRYREIGVCALHDHSHEWFESGDKRQCARCGKEEKKTIQIIEKVIWS